MNEQKEPTMEARQQGERLCGCRICFEEGACSRAIAIATVIEQRDKLKAEVERLRKVHSVAGQYAMSERDTARDKAVALKALLVEALSMLGSACNRSDGAIAKFLTRPDVVEAVKAERQERCSRCGNMTRNWVDPDWAGGRICLLCESRYRPDVVEAVKEVK